MMSYDMLEPILGEGQLFTEVGAQLNSFKEQAQTTKEKNKIRKAQAKIMHFIH